MTTTIEPGAFRRRVTQLPTTLLLAACWLAGPAAQAAPTLPQVVAGQASFTQQGNVFSITNTPGTIINWQSFDIGAGEITRFIQQSSDSAVLNRVTGQDPTKVLGALQSNGKVFLINPNGILFGQGARVDVNGLVASTLNLSDADFLAGKKNFQAGAGSAPGAGTLRNDGAITTPGGGKVFLIAPDVENKGIITAPNGEVVLAAGRSVQLVDSSDPNLQVVVSAPKDQALNLGQVIAQGGRIGIYGALVNQRGLVNADSAVVGANGRIVLKASGATTLGAGSATSAAGAGKGGEIQVLGRQVAIEGQASVDASGRLGGGTVLVGGDVQGAGGVQRAQSTRVDAGAGIRADATLDGKGGKVVLWSDGETRAAGSISARGAGSGNGGLVETSGHVLNVDGIAVNAGGGKAGKNGSWLLDPYDIEVVAGGTAGANDVRSASNGAASGVTKVAPATLTAAGTDVVLQAQHDLTIIDALNAAGSVRAQAGNDINVNAQVSSSGGDLDFRAGNAFNLGTSGSLKTPNYIDIAANRVTLAGGIGGLPGTQLPILSFTSFDPGRTIHVGSGTPDSSVLWLDAATLGRLSSGLFEINLGNSLHTAPVSIGAALNAASNLVLENSGKIYVQAPVNLSANPDSRFIASLYGGGSGLIQVSSTLTASKSVLLQGDRVWIDAAVNATGANGSVTLMPNNTGTKMSIGGSGNETGFSIGQDALSSIHASQLTIGGLAGSTGGLEVSGMVNLAGEGALPKLNLDAGNGELAIRAPLVSAGTVTLNSGLGIYESSDGAVQARAVAVRGGQVVLSGDNRIGTLSGAATGANVFQVTNAGAMSVGNVDGLAGIGASGASLQLEVAGDLRLDADIRGAVMAQLDAGGIGGSGTLQADTVSLRATGGIGSTTAPLHTEAKALMAYNAGSGNRPINIANQGALVLISAVQDGAANTGAIAIDSVGGMTVPAYTAGEPGYSTGEVRTSSGDINLATHSPMTIMGRVTTDSGNVNLVADNGGALTIAAGARVASGSGSVSVTAGSTRIADGAISVSSPDKLHLPGSSGDGGQQQPTPDQPTPGQTTPPGLDTCLATPGAAGCADVIAKAVQACTIDPNGANCGRVLPKLETCQATPSAPGCSVVLAHHEIDVCLADPKQAGCDSKIPSYETCQGNASSYGCGPVIQRHDAITACILNPAGPGCAQTLPTLGECRANAAVYGCVPVLARAQFESCVAHPEGAGCLENVLPKLPVCKLTPSLEGCAQVIEASFQACLARPNDASCSGVLPTLSQCVNKSSERGCDAVLPTLNQCIGSPSLQGCSVRLPSLQTCAASPSTPGCQAVLPQPDFCGTHPGDPSCAVFTGNGGGVQNSDGKQVAQAVQGAVQLINQGRPTGTPPTGKPIEGQDNKNPGQDGRATGPAQAENTGAKNEKPATKMYCN